MKTDSNTTLIIAKSDDILKEITEAYKANDEAFVLISDIQEALSYLEKNSPKNVITEHTLEFQAAEPLAIRFSELVMFNHSAIYMITSGEITKFEHIKFNSLGFESIIKHSEFSTKFHDIYNKNHKLSA